MPKCNEVKISRNTFIYYVYKTRYQLLLLGMFLLLVYGIRLFTLFITIDTEGIISTPESTYKSWFELGRFGLVFLKKIFGTYTFNVYEAAFMMIFSAVATTIVWCYLFYVISGQKNKIILWIFGALFFTSPIMAEQEAFLLQAYEVTVAMGLIAVSLLFEVEFIRSKKWYMALCAVAILTVSFGTYQAMVTLYITAATMVFILYYEKAANVTNLKDKLLYILQLIIFFLGAYVCYSVINKLILRFLNLQTNSYLTDQMLWGKQPLSEIAKNIGDYIVNVLGGNGFFYSKIILVLYVANFVRVLFRKKLKDYWIYVMTMTFLCLCPFLMVIIRGGYTT